MAVQVPLGCFGWQAPRYVFGGGHRHRRKFGSMYVSRKKFRALGYVSQEEVVL